MHDPEYVGTPFACITKYGITDGLPTMRGFVNPNEEAWDLSIVSLAR